MRNLLRTLNSIIFSIMALNMLCFDHLIYKEETADAHRNSFGSGSSYGGTVTWSS
jgi:hypothetical protein